MVSSAQLVKVFSIWMRETCEASLSLTALNVFFWSSQNWFERAINARIFLTCTTRANKLPSQPTGLDWTKARRKHRRILFRLKSFWWEIHPHKRHGARLRTRSRTFQMNRWLLRPSGRLWSNCRTEISKKFVSSIQLIIGEPGHSSSYCYCCCCWQQSPTNDLLFVQDVRVVYILWVRSCSWY